MATTNDLKNGMTLNIDGQLWNVVEFQHVKPGKGGAFVRTKLKNVMSGKVVDRTFNASVKVDVANVDKREMQYLYREGEDFVFMDTRDYDQPRIPAAVVGDAANFLLEEQTATVAFNDGVPLYVELPAAVELTITRPTRACRATGPPAAPSRPRWRPARRCRCRCSSRPARRSGWTPAPANTSAAPDRPRSLPGIRDHARTQQGPQARPRCAVRGRAARRARTRTARPAGRRRQPAGLALRRRAGARRPAHRERIDELLAAYAEDWTLDRMPAVDRNILRIGAYELLWAGDVPDGVAISEAVQLARSLSTEASPAFVNGLLARLLELKPTLADDIEDFAAGS